MDDTMQEQADTQSPETEAKQAEEVGEDSVKLNGLEIVRNFQEDRLQLLFDGKPDEEVRTILKSRGFRWSPRFGAWQRKLTNEAVRTLKQYILTQSAFAQYR